MTDQTPNLTSMGLVKTETAADPAAKAQEDDGMDALGVLLESVQNSLQPVKEEMQRQREAMLDMKRTDAALRMEIQALKNRMNMMEQLVAFMALKDPDLQKRMAAMAEATTAAEAMEKADANKKQVLPDLPKAP